jgi:hypothetical protein
MADVRWPKTDLMARPDGTYEMASGDKESFTFSIEATKADGTEQTATLVDPGAVVSLRDLRVLDEDGNPTEVTGATVQDAGIGTKSAEVKVDATGFPRNGAYELAVRLVRSDARERTTTVRIDIRA